MKRVEAKYVCYVVTTRFVSLKIYVARGSIMEIFSDKLYTSTDLICIRSKAYQWVSVCNSIKKFKKCRGCVNYKWVYFFQCVVFYDGYAVAVTQLIHGKHGNQPNICVVSYANAIYFFIRNKMSVFVIVKMNFSHIFL